MTDLVLTRCDKATANQMAKNALEYNAGWFYAKYGVLWPMKWFSSVVAFFVKDELRYLGSSVQTVEGCKQRITVDVIKERFIDVNGFPESLWMGDTTTELLINTFLTAFIDNGYGVDEEDDVLEDVAIDGEPYTKIRGETCKLHSKKPYKNWNIYRAWNISEGHGKMKYFAVKDGMILSAKNLSGIKDEVSKKRDING